MNDHVPFCSQMMEPAVLMRLPFPRVARPFPSIFPSPASVSGGNLGEPSVWCHRVPVDVVPSRRTAIPVIIERPASVRWWHGTPRRRPLAWPKRRARESRRGLLASCVPSPRRRAAGRPRARAQIARCRCHARGATGRARTLVTPVVIERSEAAIAGAIARVYSGLDESARVCFSGLDGPVARHLPNAR